MANEFFTEQDFDITDTTATIERPKPPVEEEESGALKEAKAIGIETGIPLGTGIATSPWLLAGPKGWIAYGALNMASGMTSSALAQKFRNPEKDTSFPVTIGYLTTKLFTSSHNAAFACPNSH